MTAIIEAKLIESECRKYLSEPAFIRSGLRFFAKYSSVRAQSFHAMYFAADLLKSVANNHFKRREISRAIEFYEEALAVFRYVRPHRDAIKRDAITDADLEYIVHAGDNEKELLIINQFQHVLFLNLALCYIRVGAFSDSIAACTQDLTLYPTSIKSLYRRAFARYSSPIGKVEDNYRLAILDLKRAQDIDPTDQDIKDLLVTIESARIEGPKKQQSLSQPSKQSHYSDSSATSSKGKQSHVATTAATATASAVSSGGEEQQEKNSTTNSQNEEQQQNSAKEKVQTSKMSKEEYIEHLKKTNPTYENYYRQQQEFAERIKNKRAKESLNSSFVSSVSTVKQNESAFTDGESARQSDCQSDAWSTTSSRVKGESQANGNAMAAGATSGMSTGIQKKQSKKKQSEQARILAEIEEEMKAQKQHEIEMKRKEKELQELKEKQAKKDQEAKEQLAKAAQEKEVQKVEKMKLEQSKKNQESEIKKAQQEKKLIEEQKLQAMKQAEEERKRIQAEKAALETRQAKELLKARMAEIKPGIHKKLAKGRSQLQQPLVSQQQSQIYQQQMLAQAAANPAGHQRNIAQPERQIANGSAAGAEEEEEERHQLTQQQISTADQTTLNVGASTSNGKKPSLKNKQVFEEDNFFDSISKQQQKAKKGAANGVDSKGRVNNAVGGLTRSMLNSMQQYNEENGEEDDEAYDNYQQHQQHLAQEEEEMAPYIPANPMNQKEGDDAVDICEGNSILNRKQHDKIFQHSFKANYEEYLERKLVIDSDSEYPEIPGIIPPQSKNYQQTRLENILGEQPKQLKKEMGKVSKIVVWVAVVVFVFALIWAITQDDTLPDVTELTVEPAIDPLQMEQQMNEFDDFDLLLDD